MQRRVVFLFRVGRGNDILSPSKETAEPIVAKGSKKIIESPVVMTSSSARLSWLGLISVALAGRWEMDVSALIDAVAPLLALVSPVSSVPTEARAASVSRAEEFLDSVVSVASKVRVQNEMKSGKAVRPCLRTYSSGICLHSGEKIIESGDCRRILTDCDQICNSR